MHRWAKADGYGYSVSTRTYPSKIIFLATMPTLND